MAVDIGALRVVLGADVSDYTRQLNRAMGQTRNFADTAKTALVSGLAVGIAGVAAGFGAAVKKAADFEEEMSNIKALTGATGKEFKQIKRLAIEMGAKTKFSAMEAGQGIEELLKAGVSLEEVMGGGLKGALDLAVAGELDLASAAEIASTALNAFKKDNLKVSQAADILAGAANASATSVAELRFGLAMSSAVAAGVGMTFKDTSTALAVFAQNGLKGSDAGTSLKSMLMNLQPATDKQAIAMERLGLITKDGNSIFYDAQGHIKNLADIGNILQTSMKDLTDAQRIQAMETIFGSDAVRAANILFKEGAKGVNEMNAAMSKVTAAEVAKEKLNNLKGVLEQFKGAAETMAISLGTKAIPVLTDFVKWATEKLPTVQSKLENVIEALSKFKSKIDFSAITKSLKELKDMAEQGDWGAIGKALGEALRSTTIDFGGWIKEQIAKVDWAAVGKQALSVVVPFIIGFAAALFDVGVWAGIIKQNWKEILTVAIGIMLLPSSWMAKIASGLAKIPFVGKILEWMVTGLVAIGSKIKAPIKNLADTWGRAILGGMIDGLKSMFAPLINAMGKGVSSLDNVATKFLLKGAKFMYELGRGITETAPKAVWGAIRKIATKFDDILGGVPSKMLSVGKNIVTGLWNGIKERASWLYGKVTGWAKNIVQKAKDALGEKSPSKEFIKVGENVVAGLAKGIADSVAVLDTALAIMHARFDIYAAKLGVSANKELLLTAQVKSLSEQYGVAAKKVAVLTAGYQKMASIKGKTAAETQRLYLELLQATKAQVDIKNEIDATKKALVDYKKEIADYGNQFTATMIDANKEMADSFAEYQQKMTDTVAKSTQDQQKLWDDYYKAVENRAGQISSFSGLFDKSEIQKTADNYGATLLDNLLSQVGTLQTWGNEMARFSERVVDEGLIKELSQMGPKALPELIALNSLTQQQLDQYVSLWQQKNALARSYAAAELVGMKDDTIAKVQEIQEATKVELSKLEDEWYMTAIRIRSSMLSALQSIVDAMGGAFSSPFARQLQARINVSHRQSIIPQYAQGTDYVPRTGLALLHQGEAVIPASQNSGGSIVITVTGNTISSNMDINRIGDELVRTLRRKGVKI